MSVKTLARRLALSVAVLVLAPAASLAQCGADLCGSCCDPCCDNGGWYGGVQYLLLAPKVNSRGFERIFYDGVDFSSVEVDGSFEDDLEGGVRFVAGNETCCGFGGRVRYFSYDNDIGYRGLWDAGSGTVSVQGSSEIDVDAIDFEVTQRVDCCCWNTILGAGLRYGSVDFRQDPGLYGSIPSPPLINPNNSAVEFDGVGPTFSVGASRCLGHGLSVVGQARTSLLFGDIDVTRAFSSTNRTVADEFVQVWEFQFGLNYQTCLNGHNVTAGVFWEAQRWDSESNFLGDLALHGLGFSGGVTF